jgi:hypothetical protein
MKPRTRCYFCKRPITQKRVASFVRGYPYVCCEPCEQWAVKVGEAKAATKAAQDDVRALRESLALARQALARVREFATRCTKEREMSLRDDEAARAIESVGRQVLEMCGASEED